MTAVLLLPAAICIVLGVLAGWWMRDLHQRYSEFDAVERRRQAHDALCELCDHVDVPPFTVVVPDVVPFDWAES